MEKKVLVTGSSTGIGLAACRLLKSEGFFVYAGVRSLKDAQEFEREGFHPLILDVTRSQDIQRAAGEIPELYGLVNNAGVVVAGPLECLPLDEFRSQLEINLVGVLAVTQAFLPVLRKSQGRIVNISSVSGRFSFPFVGAYCASKFGLEAMSDALRVELDPWKIKVCLVEPGPVKTPIWEKSIERGAKNVGESPIVKSLYGKQLEIMRKQVADAEKHATTPETVAQEILQALTNSRPRSRYVVGAGGYLQLFMSHLPDGVRDWAAKKIFEV